MARAAVRRVVTGHDDEGKAIILYDGDAPNSFESPNIPGFGATVPWWTPADGIDHVSDDDLATADAEIPSFPAEGETILRIADFPPAAVYPNDAEAWTLTEQDGRGAAPPGK